MLRGSDCKNLAGETTLHSEYRDSVKLKSAPHLPVDSSGKPAQGVQDAGLFLRCRHLGLYLAQQLLKRCASLVPELLQSLHWALCTGHQ